jgi:non-canonical (house-cleaning) NTP pyrophosphatase
MIRTTLREIKQRSNNSYSLDQVELTFGLDYGVVTAQIDIQWTTMMVLIDQAFTTYDLGNGFAITAGRYDSMLGFEAFEPLVSTSIQLLIQATTEAFEMTFRH